jgi:3-hydroxymyristoyl/3-hydroxydecanoyl-(acyl carrier protein) dehydratase
MPINPPEELDREACLAFAVGKIGPVLGCLFSEIDTYPTRVRLPDEPLMLVDRILNIEGEPVCLRHADDASGHVVTEHDILPGAWYLDACRIPTCIAVEAGQADLFLSGYLGIDYVTKGLRVYRLLDAVVTFHGGLPGPGNTIRYDIRIKNFFRQGPTWLFRFEFDATVSGQPLLTMRDGCAGFFTAEELAAGQGVIRTARQLHPPPGKSQSPSLAPPPVRPEAYSPDQLNALRHGDLAGCFGPDFVRLSLKDPIKLPGATQENLRLVDRIMHLDFSGGRYGVGLVRGELDIDPDAWFLTCHFVDDMVMPGTLMYECCMHTLRVLLMRAGWVVEEMGADGRLRGFEPVPGVQSRLKCRGQVVRGCKTVLYELEVKEWHQDPGQAPYVLADALMYADGKPIVEITDMSARLSGATIEELVSVWSRTSPTKPAPEPLFDSQSILAFCIGNPSEAFGAPYAVFDHDRIIARLPGPPYLFLDRIMEIHNCEAFKLSAGGSIITEYDVPSNAWYFSDDRQPRMPFAVLLEAALQPCGWFSAYLGSALTSKIDLSYRNLGGTAVQHRPVTPDSGTLRTVVEITNVSNAGGMLIQHFKFCMSDFAGEVYTGTTYFGFFTKAALANQVGLRDARPKLLTLEQTRTSPVLFPTRPPYATGNLKLLDRILVLEPSGGAAGLGYILGEADVDPSAWFFKAHFYQDPVMPGSLGLEAFIHLLRHLALQRWGEDAASSSVHFEQPALPTPNRPEPRHAWVYRGQVLPTDRTVKVEAEVSGVDDASRTLSAHGFLSVDGRIIYQMQDFTIRLP